jgi:signal transduction histidine kinase
MALLIHTILRSYGPKQWFFYAIWGVLSVQAVNTALILTGFAFVALPINLLIFSTLPAIALLGVLSTRDMPRSTKRILTASALIFGMVVLFGVINSTNIFHGNESTTLFEGVADRKLSGLGFGLFVLAFLVSENTKKKFIAYQEKQKLQLMIVNSQQQTQAIKDRGMLIDMLTHEIKNPLGTIRFAANALWDAVDKEPSQKERFHRLMSSVNRINDLLEQVALSNKVERSDLVLEKERVAIRDFIEDLVDDLNEPRRFQTAITADLSHHINRGMLTIALENLLVNAAKYSPSGTPILIEAASLVTPPNNAHGRLDNADSGIRIRVENQLSFDAHPDLSLLFKPYYRHPVSGQQPGMGLGLSLVKTAVEKLGGVIDVSIQNDRIFFEVSLP